MGDIGSNELTPMLNVTMGYRGSTVELVNESMAIQLVTDWLEGELTVTLQTLDGSAMPLDAVVDTAGAGLSLMRMKRGITLDMITQRLETAARLLVSQAPDLLVGDRPTT